MKIGCNSESINGKTYVPPVISNGAICTQVDYRGWQAQDKDYYGHVLPMIPSIFWAGRRYADARASLIPFGHFEDEVCIGGEVVKDPSVWEQDLDRGNAVVECLCEYGDGIKVGTSAFVHMDHNLIAIKKRFDPGGFDGYTFKYVFAKPGTEMDSPSYSKFDITKGNDGKIVDLEYCIDGAEQYRGLISIVASEQAEISIVENIISFSCKKTKGEVSFAILFSDSADGEDFREKNAALKTLIGENGFAGLLESHKSGWKEFWDKSYVNIPSQGVQDAYYTAQYNLRCYSTNWSIPVGVFPSHWQGLYFGFTFFVQALCASNHMREARKVPAFRHAVLDKAISRTSSSKYPPVGARYPWQSDEKGDRECSSAGFWLDHVLHMCNISWEAWSYYLYTSDRQYLSEIAYPVIKACAEFFVIQMIYELKDGRTVVGRCTDLERLQPVAINAFLTTCGVIGVLEWAAEAASILDVDAAKSEEWRDIAKRLKEHLPNDGDKYIPYPECEERSIGVMGGIFPYAVLDGDDSMQINAIADFCANSDSGGNMYKVGKRVCSWYLSWMAVTFARLRDNTKPVEFLEGVARDTGCFAEIFEINEPGVYVSVPWCSSPPGNYIQAVNELLLQSSGDVIFVAPAVPDNWRDYSFRLCAHDDLTVEFEVMGGEIKELIITAGKNHSGREKTLVILHFEIELKVCLKKRQEYYDLITKV